MRPGRMRPGRMHGPGRGAPLVIASNRGPVEFVSAPDGTVSARRGGGGLIAVLGPALAARDGVWVAGTMTEADREVARRAEADNPVLHVPVEDGTVALRSVVPDPADADRFYRTISTQTLWFLHHHLFDLSREPLFGAGFREAWDAYERVNEAFAAACAEPAAANGTVLLQDYHLAVAPAMLRARRPDLRIAHFTMCPWAEPAYFAQLPGWAAGRLVEGMLGASMLSFLVPRWAGHFLECCRALGFRVDTGTRTVYGRGRATAVRTHPVGVDVAALRSRAAGPAVRAEADRARRLLAGRRLILRVDRMEPAKNILRGVHAYGQLLDADPGLHRRVVHYVLAYASRGDLPEYQRYARDVHRAVDDVNDRFGRPDWQPVILDTRNNLDRALAVMSLADVLVVNPIRDGMNLVAKEAPAVSTSDVAVILSREAGAVDELADGATVVNPFDTAELADAMAAALAMPVGERRRRIALLRRAAGALPPRLWLCRVLADLDGITAPPIGPHTAAPTAAATGPRAH